MTIPTYDIHEVLIDHVPPNSDSNASENLSVSECPEFEMLSPNCHQVPILDEDHLIDSLWLV